jgi:LysR family cyn operon transcriptional activator
MEIRHLKYFIKAAELCHFTRAAEELYVSQPALSAQIRQLEEEIGSELFARVGRNVRLTEAGQAFLVRAREAVSAVESAEAELNAMKGVLKGNLNICSVAAVGGALLPPFIKALHSAYPDIYVKLSSSTSDHIERGLLEGRYCLGLVPLPPDNEEFHSLEIYSDEIVVALPAQHKLASRKSLQAKDLNNIPMVLASEHLVTPRGIGYLQEQNAQLKIVAESEEIEGVFGLLRENSFITLLPKALVPPNLISVPLRPGPPAVKLGLIWTRLSPAAEAFLKLVSESSTVSP